MNDSLTLFLLTIRGTLSPSTLEAARNVHNQTAGNPAGVAGAQALGDISHMVYVPMQYDGHTPVGAGELLVMDLWQSVEGLSTFFSDPQVQEGAIMIFAERDPVVWAPADGFTTFHIPAPFGKNDRVITTVRGMVKSVEEAKAVHNAMLLKTVSKGRKLGMLSHEVYFRLAAPGTPEALEFFGVDVWMSGEGLGEFYGDEDFMAGFSQLFVGDAVDGTWVHPQGEWIEW